MPNQFPGLYSRGRITAVVSAVVVTGVLLTACSAASPAGEQPEASAPTAASSATATADASVNGTITAVEDGEKPVVFATFPILQDIAQNVAGDDFIVQSILEAGEGKAEIGPFGPSVDSRVYSYEVTADDVLDAADADLFIANGLGLERGFTKILESGDAPVVTASQGVEPVAIADGPASGDPNPYAWMSPRNVELYVDNIVAAFTQLAPKDTDDFKRNAKAYKAELESVGNELSTLVKGVPSKKQVLLSDAGSLSYFDRDAGATEKYLLPVGQEETSTEQMGGMIDYLRDSGLRTAFRQSTSSGNVWDSEIADAMLKTPEGKLESFPLLVDQFTDPDDSSTTPLEAHTYLDLIRADIQAISSALK